MDCRHIVYVGGCHWYLKMMGENTLTLQIRAASGRTDAVMKYHTHVVERHGLRQDADQFDRLGVYEIKSDHQDFYHCDWLILVNQKFQWGKDRLLQLIHSLFQSREN